MSARSRRRFDDDNFTFDPNLLDHHEPDPKESEADERWSTYIDALHGPEPLPSWVITSPGAVDDDLGVMKTGKEADVSLVRRVLDQQTSSLMAVKRYRDAQHRMFHRDTGYLEGRKEQKSRDRRAMERRTDFGRGLIAGRWAHAEFEVLGRLWLAGAAVPYPVQLLGVELMMEFIGSPDGVAAPRLAQLRPTRRETADLFAQLRHVLLRVAEAGFAHGDLSAYNVLVDDGRLVLIDVPQAVDLMANPQGLTYLQRDCTNICSWFTARGLDVDTNDLCRELLAAAT